MKELAPVYLSLIKRSALTNEHSQRMILFVHPRKTTDPGPLTLASFIILFED